MGERRTISRNKISRGKRSRYRETKTKSKKYKRGHKGGARIKKRSVGGQRGGGSAQKFFTKDPLHAAAGLTAVGAAAGAGSGLMTGVGAGVGATAGAVAGAAVVPAAGAAALGLGLAAGTVAAAVGTLGAAAYAFYTRFAGVRHLDFPKYQAAIGLLKYKQTLDEYLKVKAIEEAGEEARRESGPLGIYKVVDKNARGRTAIEQNKYYILWVRHGKSHSNEGQDLYKGGLKNAYRIFQTTAGSFTVPEEDEDIRLGDETQRLERVAAARLAEEAVVVDLPASRRGDTSIVTKYDKDRGDYITQLGGGADETTDVQGGGSRAGAVRGVVRDDSQTLNNMRLFSMEDRYKKIFELMKSPQNMEQYLSNKESAIDADGSGVFPIDIGTQGKGLSSPTFFPPKESSMYLHPPGLSTVGSIQAVMAGEGIKQLFENGVIDCKLNKTICTSCIPRAALTAKLISCGLSGLGEDKFVNAEKSRIRRIYGIGEKRAIVSEDRNYYARSFTRGHTSMSGSDSSLWEGTGDPKDISLNMSNNYMKKFNELYPMFPIDEDTGSILFTETIKEHAEASNSGGDCNVIPKGEDKEAEIFKNIVRNQCSQGAVTVIACHGDFMKKKILKGADKMFLHSTNNCDAVLVEYDPEFLTGTPDLGSTSKRVIQRFDLRLPKDFDDLLAYHKKTLSLVGETTPAETTPDQGDADSIKFALRCEALNMQIQNVSYRPLQKEMKERQEILKEVMGGLQTIAMPAIVDYERLCSPHENTKGLSSRKSGTIIMSLLNLEKYESNKAELLKSVDELIKKIFKKSFKDTSDTDRGDIATEYFVIFCSLLYNITWDDDIFKYLFIACGRSVLKSEEDKGLFDYFESTKRVLLDEVMIETGKEGESQVLKAYLEQNKEYLRGLLMGIEELFVKHIMWSKQVRSDTRAAEAAEKSRVDKERSAAAAAKVKQERLLKQTRSDDAAAAAARVAADEPFNPRISREQRRAQMLKGAWA